MDFYTACRNGNIDTVKLLITNKSDCDLIDGMEFACENG